MPGNGLDLTGKSTQSTTGVLALGVLFGKWTGKRLSLDSHSVYRAASNVFQDVAAVANDPATMPERCIAGSTLTKYVAVERRQGLAAMGQRLLRGVPALFPQCRPRD